MEQDGPQSINHEDLQIASDEQTFKNVCVHTKVSNKFLSLANRVCFRFWYTLDIFYINLLKIVFFFSEVPTSVLPKE